MGIVDIVTKFRFYVLNHDHLAEDIFILEGAKALSRVGRDPTSENIEVALLYEPADEVVPVVEGYLTKKIHDNSWLLARALEKRALMKIVYGPSARDARGNWRSLENSLHHSMKMGRAADDVERYLGIRDVLAVQLKALQTDGLEEFTNSEYALELK